MSMEYPKTFEQLITCFKRLPGIGGKSAERMAYHILSMDDKYIHEFYETLQTVKEDTKYCSQCGHMTQDDICAICSDTSRDRRTICIVENSKDVFAMEKIKEYRGLYHVLHGTMSIMDGKTLEDLNIASLFDRIEDIDEIIIATNPTREGETTALYLAKLLEKQSITVSRIANGLPIGSNIDYADELTLLKSLEGRKKI